MMNQYINIAPVTIGNHMGKQMQNNTVFLELTYLN